MIMHTADSIACLLIGRRIGDDSGTALLAPLAALPVDFVLVGRIT